MKAWKVTAASTIECIDLGAQPVPDDSVKVKMKKSALGLTDVLTYRGLRGALPMTVGREGVGMVSETGKNVQKVRRGDRVYIGAAEACGECAACRGDRRRECSAARHRGMEADGAMSDFAVVKEDDLYVLPAKVTDTEAVFLERTATGIRILDTLNVEKGEYIAVMGANVTGILLAQLALYYQAVPILVDVRRDRLDIAERLGIYYTVDAVSTDPLKKIMAITCGKGAETMCYTTPSSLPLTRAFEALTPGGRAVISALNGSIDTLPIDLAPLFERGITVSFVHTDNNEIPAAINAFASGAVEAEPLVSFTCPFDAVGKTLQALADDPTKSIRTIVNIE